MKDVMTIDERVKFITNWYTQFGAESLFKQYAEFQEFMSNRCKAYRSKIDELERQLGHSNERHIDSGG